jgi:hypothetical protein
MSHGRGTERFLCRPSETSWGREGGIGKYRGTASAGRCFGRSDRSAQRHHWLLRSITPTRATFWPSRPDGADGGTAQAAPELPRPPVRPQDRPKTYLPDHPRATRTADVTRGDCRLPRQVLRLSSPGVCLPASGPVDAGIGGLKMSGCYLLQATQVKLGAELSPACTSAVMGPRRAAPPGPRSGMPRGGRRQRDRWTT